MQPGEFTLPGRLRSLPQRQSHHQTALQQNLSKSSGFGCSHCKASSLGSAFWGPTAPNQSDSSRGCGPGKPPWDKPTFPFSPLQQQGCSLQSRQRWQTLQILQGETHTEHSSTRSTGGVLQPLPPPLARGFPPAKNQPPTKQRDRDVPQPPVINETAIYAIILMLSTLGAISSRELMTLQSTVQHGAVTPAKRGGKKKGP